MHPPNLLVCIGALCGCNFLWFMLYIYGSFLYNLISTDTVTTMTTGLTYPWTIAFTQSGSLTYVLTDTQLFTMSQGGATSVLAGSGGTGFADGQGTAARIWGARGLVIHPMSGIIYIADGANHRIRTCTPLGLVGTLAGTGTPSNVDGAFYASTFNWPFGILMDPTFMYLYVTCFYGNTLRQVVVLSGFTTSLAGSGASSSVDGQGLLASFYNPAYANADV